MRSAIALWVLGFVLAGIAALVFLALQISNAETDLPEPTYRVVAEFGDVGNLKVGAPVSSAGVVVGRVARIAFDAKHYKARVTLRIDSGYRFPVDSSASILTSGLLGDEYAALDAGAQRTMLADGDTISVTHSAMESEQILRKLEAEEING